MRTRTIFEAYTKACIDTLNAKEWRQRDTFERELLRRMDERDALVTQKARILGNLQTAWQNNTNLARKLYASKEVDHEPNRTP